MVAQGSGGVEVSSEVRKHHTVSKVLLHGLGVIGCLSKSNLCSLGQ